MKVVNLINLDTIGGVERLYRQWLLSTSVKQQITLSDRYTIHKYIFSDVSNHSKIYYTKKNRFIPLPKVLRERHIKNILRRESPDVILVWNKIDSRIVNYITGQTPVIFYDHGASWLASKEGVESDYWNKIDKIICVSHSAEKIINHRFPDTRSIKTDVIYNPNLVNPRPLPAKTKQETFNFGIASRIIARKGIPIALDAIKLLLDDNVRVHLYVAGSGKHLEKLKLYCQKLNIEDHVSWMGNIDDMQGFYNKIQTLICPSIYEPFGLTVFEAASYGVPAIVSAVDGIYEAVNLVNGVQIKPKISIEDYAKKYGFRTSELDSLSYFHETGTVAPSLAVDPEDLYYVMKKMATDSPYYLDLKNETVKSLYKTTSIIDWAKKLDNSILC
ncbi:MAG: glycosyltransferase [Arenicellales bacterium]